MCWGRQGLQEQAEGARCESKTACNKSTNATTCTIPASLREGGVTRMRDGRSKRKAEADNCGDESTNATTFAIPASLREGGGTRKRDGRGKRRAETDNCGDRNQ